MKDAHRTPEELLDDIVSWGDRVSEITGGVDFEGFVDSELIHLSVWKCVEVVGEASGRLLRSGFAIEDAALKRELRQASDMRNRLTHGYSGVDLQVLWATARHFVPSLADRLRLLRR